MALARIPRRATWAGNSTAPKGRDMEQAHPRSRHREELSNCHSQMRAPKCYHTCSPFGWHSHGRHPQGKVYRTTQE